MTPWNDSLDSSLYRLAHDKALEIIPDVTSNKIIQTPATRHDVWRPGKVISSKCPLWLCATHRNRRNQVLLFTVIQVSSFGVVTSSYLDSTTWPSRRCSRSLCTSELSSTAATVYANLSKEGRKEGSVVIIVTWQPGNHELATLFTQIFFLQWNHPPVVMSTVLKAEIMPHFQQTFPHFT